MKISVIKFYCIILYVLVPLNEASPDRYGNQNYKYHSDNDGRLYSRYFSYSNTEFEHAIDDDRCEGRPVEPRHIVKETAYGNVRGRLISLCDTPGLDFPQRPKQPTAYGPKNAVRVFLGIPYAEAPIRENNLQFKPPKGPVRFGQLDASRYKPACPQNDRYFSKGEGINTTSEDCLYLNIFSPGQVNYDQPVQEKYAVMFYIHEGNWDHGSSALFPGHMLAASQQVVVVTFNYRLGPLGFLATADRHSPGNYGMLDQIAALKWVHENIAVFDGDSRRITVFGSGAGGASAALLALSPLSRRLIRRVIAQNGSPVADWAAISDPRFMFNTSEIVGEGLGCVRHDSSRFVDCVGKKINEIKILKTKPRIGWLPWVPVVDNFTREPENQFLPESPKEMLEKGALFHEDFAYMSGINRDQGVSIFMEDFITFRDLEIDEGKFDQKIKDFMKMYNYSVNAEGIFDAIKFMYKPPVDSSNRTLLRQAYIKLLTDRYFMSSLDSVLQLMLKNKVKTYGYVLNYTLQGYSLLLNEFVSSEVEFLLLSGAPFMDPKFYPSKFNLQNARWTEEDRDMSQAMMQAWGNFAKEGNPTTTRLFNTIFWEPMTEKDFHYLFLNSTEVRSTMVRDYRQRQSLFWNTFLPFLIDREPPTLAPTLEPGVSEIRVVTSALWGSVAVATLLIIITLVCCVLYCRVRRYDSY